MAGAAWVLVLLVAIPPLLVASGGGGDTTKRRWLVTDHLGSGVVWLDEAGLRIRHAEYAPFGKVDAGYRRSRRHRPVFVNRRRDKIKILYWERSGFVLWYKRLEKERFPWPAAKDDEVMTLTGRELNWLLDGLDIFRVRPHEILRYRATS